VVGGFFFIIFHDYLWNAYQTVYRTTPKMALTNEIEGLFTTGVYEFHTLAF
jgi:hypothetical protein